MPHPRQSPEQLAAMRTRILDAALAILRAKGPQALSARSIAHHLGVAHMSLFTYFANQGALLQALAERETAPLRARQAELEADQDIVAATRRSLELFPAFEREDPGLFHLAWVIPQQTEAGMGRAQARADENVAHLALLIARGVASGAFHVAESALAATAAIGMVTFPLVLFHSGRLTDRALCERLVAEMLDAALGYLRREPA